MKSELKKLRKKYEKETEKSKAEFMSVHSKKVFRKLTVFYFSLHQSHSHTASMVTMAMG